MFLTATNLVHFLIAKKLVDLSTIVDGDFSVLELGRRNRNFQVSLGLSTGLFVKQSKASDALSLATFKREMDCYALAQQFPAWHALLAPLKNLDYDRHSIVLELIANSESLTQYHWRIRRFSPLIAEKLAHALSQFHVNVKLDDLSAEQLRQYPQKTLWILDLIELPNSASGGAQQMFRFMQQHSAFRAGMQSLKQNWQFDCLIHGDMKWDNCLVHPDVQQQPRLTLIDWELIDVGDAHWDVAGLMHSFFVFWIESELRRADMNEVKNITELLVRENEGQTGLRQSLWAFWRAYQRGIGRSERDRLALVRVFGFVSARLVLTCYEGVCQAKEMSLSMSLILQLAAEMFRDSDRLVQHWLPQIENLGDAGAEHA